MGHLKIISLPASTLSNVSSHSPSHASPGSSLVFLPSAALGSSSPSAGFKEFLNMPSGFEALGLKLAKENGVNTQHWSSTQAKQYAYSQLIDKSVAYAKKAWQPIQNLHRSHVEWHRQRLDYEQHLNTYLAKQAHNITDFISNKVPDSVKRPIQKCMVGASFGLAAAKSLPPRAKLIAAGLGCVQPVIEDVLFEGASGENKQLALDIFEEFNSEFLVPLEEKLAQEFQNTQHLIIGNSSFLLDQIEKMDLRLTGKIDQLHQATNELSLQLDLENMEGFEHVTELANLAQNYAQAVYQRKPAKTIETARKTFNKTLKKQKDFIKNFYVGLNTISDAGKLLSILARLTGNSDAAVKISAITNGLTSVVTGVSMLFNKIPRGQFASPLAPWVSIAGGIVSIFSIFQGAQQDPLLTSIRHLSKQVEGIQKTLHQHGELLQSIYTQLGTQFASLYLQQGRLANMLNTGVNMVRNDLKTIYQSLAYLETCKHLDEVTQHQQMALLHLNRMIATSQFDETLFNTLVTRLITDATHGASNMQMSLDLDASNLALVSQNKQAFPVYFLNKTVLNIMRHYKSDGQLDLDLPNTLEWAIRTNFLVNFLSQAAPHKKIEKSWALQPFQTLMAQGKNIQALARCVCINRHLFQSMFLDIRRAIDRLSSELGASFHVLQRSVLSNFEDELADVLAGSNLMKGPDIAYISTEKPAQESTVIHEGDGFNIYAVHRDKWFTKPGDKQGNIDHLGIFYTGQKKRFTAEHEDRLEKTLASIAVGLEFRHIMLAASNTFSWANWPDYVVSVFDRSFNVFWDNINIALHPKRVGTDEYPPVSMAEHLRRIDERTLTQTGKNPGWEAKLSHLNQSVRYFWLLRAYINEDITWTAYGPLTLENTRLKTLDVGRNIGSQLLDKTTLLHNGSSMAAVETILQLLDQLELVTNIGFADKPALSFLIKNARASVEAFKHPGALKTLLENTFFKEHGTSKEAFARFAALDMETFIKNQLIAIVSDLEKVLIELVQQSAEDDTHGTNQSTSPFVNETLHTLSSFMRAYFDQPRSAPDSDPEHTYEVTPSDRTTSEAADTGVTNQTPGTNPVDQAVDRIKQLQLPEKPRKSNKSQLAKMFNVMKLYAIPLEMKDVARGIK